MSDSIQSLIPLAENLPYPVKNQPYWQVATSANTRKAYQADIRHFITAGGLFTTTTEGLLYYLNQQAQESNPRTVKLRIVAIKNWHTFFMIILIISVL